MSDPKAISLGYAECIAETEKAIKVQREDGSEFWIPKSVVHDNSEVYADGHDGDLVVAEWFAQKQGLA